MKFRNRTNDSTTIAKTLLFVCLITLSITVFGQTRRSDTFYVVELSQQTKADVIKRILVNYFRPSVKPKVVYIADQGDEGIQKQWLPFIKNIEFRLLSSDEIEQKKGVYLFSEIWQKTPGLYEIAFGYGDPTCKYLGDLWNFRVSNSKLKLWRKSNDIQGDCSF